MSQRTIIHLPTEILHVIIEILPLKNRGTLSRVSKFFRLFIEKYLFDIFSKDKTVLRNIVCSSWATYRRTPAYFTHPYFHAHNFLMPKLNSLWVAACSGVIAYRTLDIPGNTDLNTIIPDLVGKKIRVDPNVVVWLHNHLSPSRYPYQLKAMTWVKTVFNEQTDEETIRMFLGQMTQFSGMLDFLIPHATVTHAQSLNGVVIDLNVITYSLKAPNCCIFGESLIVSSILQHLKPFVAVTSKDTIESVIEILSKKTDFFSVESLQTLISVCNEEVVQDTIAKFQNLKNLDDAHFALLPITSVIFNDNTPEKILISKISWHPDIKNMDVEQTKELMTTLAKLLEPIPGKESLKDFLNFMYKHQKEKVKISENISDDEMFLEEEEQNGSDCSEGYVSDE